MPCGVAGVRKFATVCLVTALLLGGYKGATAAVPDNSSAISFSLPDVLTGEVPLTVQATPGIASYRLNLEGASVTDYRTNFSSYLFPSQALRDAERLRAQVIGYDANRLEKARSSMREVRAANHGQPLLGASAFLWAPEFKSGLEGVPPEGSVALETAVAGRKRLVCTWLARRPPGVTLNLLIDEQPIRLIRRPTNTGADGDLKNRPWLPGRWAPSFGAEAGGDVDTFAYANGTHTLTVMQRGVDTPDVKLFHQYRFAVRFENGHTPMRLRARHSEYVLSIGQTRDLSSELNLEYTDLKGAHPVKAVFSVASAMPGIIRVEPDGRITGLKPGLAEVQAACDNDYVAYLLVWVGQEGFPHFTRDGQIVRQYTPGASFIPRSLFHSFEALQKDPVRTGLYRKAGFNCLEAGLISSPWSAYNALQLGQIPPATDAEFLKRYCADADKIVNTIAGFCQTNNLHWIVTGDEFARFGQYVWVYSYDYVPWALPSFVHCMKRLQECGQVVAMEMVDEVGMMCSPMPNLDRAKARQKDANPDWHTPWEDNVKGHVAKTGKPIQPDVAERMMAATEGKRPPTSWPLFSLHGMGTGCNWAPFNEPPYPGAVQVADYTSWQWGLNDWVQHPVSTPLRQVLGAMDWGVRLRLLEGGNIRQPLMIDWSACMPSYIKKVQAMQWVMGKDLTDDAFAAIPDPEYVERQISYLIARGAAGMRGYHMSTPDQLQRVRDTPIGGKVSDTGMDPLEVNVAGWRSAAIINGLIEELTPLILQPRLDAVDLGSDAMVVTARSGQAGTLFWSVSFLDQPYETTVDLREYAKGASSVECISLWSSQLTRTTIPKTKLGKLQLRYEAGETKVFVFH